MSDIPISGDGWELPAGWATATDGCDIYDSNERKLTCACTVRFEVNAAGSPPITLRCDGGCGNNGPGDASCLATETIGAESLRIQLRSDYDAGRAWRNSISNKAFDNTPNTLVGDAWASKTVGADPYVHWVCPTGSVFSVDYSPPSSSKAKFRMVCKTYGKTGWPTLPTDV